MRNKKLILMIVLLLAALNLWRWWPEAQEGGRIPGSQSAEDIALLKPELSLEGGHDSKIQRDIFNPVHTKKVITPKPKKKIIKNAPPPGPTPEELDRINAEKELNNIDLSGILIREGTPTALILYNGNAYTVTKGEEISARFVIIDIDSASIRIKERKHKIERTIYLGQ